MDGKVNGFKYDVANFSDAKMNLNVETFLSLALNLYFTIK